MSELFAGKKKFLRDIYENKDRGRHGFCCVPEYTGLQKLELGDFTISEKPVDMWVGWLEQNYRQFVSFNEQVGDDSVPYVFMNTGTHIFPAAFGAKVHVAAGDAPCAMPFVSSPEEADRIEAVDIWKSPTLYRIFELAGKMQSKLGKDVCISVPDMQSGFDIVATIWKKEDLFCSMITHQESVKRLVSKCSSVLREFLREYIAEFKNVSMCHCPIVWAPCDMGPWVSNDECGSFNEGMFLEFCLPELIEIAQEFGGIGMHCCADAEHQFKSFMSIPGFYAFNRVAAKQGYASILEHFDSAENPAFVLSWISDEDIEFLVRNSAPNMRYIFNNIGASVEDAKMWYKRFTELDG